MKRLLSNVVLNCKNEQELEKCEQVLTQENITDYEVFGLCVEIYLSETPEYWADIIDKINR